MNEQTNFAISGMTTVHCVAQVTRALRGVAGVTRARVDLASGEAEVEYDPAQASLEQLEKAVEDAGYSIDRQAEPSRATGMSDECCCS